VHLRGVLLLLPALQPQRRFKKSLSFRFTGRRGLWVRAALLFILNYLPQTIFLILTSTQKRVSLPRASFQTGQGSGCGRPRPAPPEAWKVRRGLHGTDTRRPPRCHLACSDGGALRVWRRSKYLRSASSPASSTRFHNHTFLEHLNHHAGF
jgi:hypothetical protein